MHTCGFTTPSEKKFLHMFAGADGALEAFVSIITGPPGPRPETLMDTIKGPLLILWGDKDPFTPVDGPVGRFLKAYSETRQECDFITLPGMYLLHFPLGDPCHRFLRGKCLPYLPPRSTLAIVPLPANTCHNQIFLKGGCWPCSLPFYILFIEPSTHTALPYICTLIYLYFVLLYIKLCTHTALHYICPSYR